MDSEDELGGRDSAFSNSRTQGKSRIADQMARQRKLQAQGQNPFLQQPAAKPGAVAKATTAKVVSAKPNAIKQINRRVDDKLAQIPTFALNEHNITRIRWIVSAQSFIILALVLTFAYGIFRLNERNIYAARSHRAGAEDQVLRLTAMNSPTHTNAAILSWATATATSVMNFGFHNANERLSAMRPNFTPDGWNAFVAAIQESNLLENVTAKQQVITTAPVGAPVLLRTVDQPNRQREWIVQIPFTVTTLSGKQTLAVRRTITLTIVDVPPTDNLSGLGIDNWIES